MKLIERLKGLEALATPGPWKIETEGFEEYEGTTYKVFPPYGDEDHYFMADANYYNTAPKKDDAVFLTELRNALPKLLAVVARAEALGSAAKELLATYDATFDLRDVSGFEYLRDASADLSETLAALEDTK